MIDRRALLLAFGALVALATAADAQRFDPRGNFDDSRGRQAEESRRLSHDQLRAIVSRQFDVREMRTSGECGREFWALIISQEGHRQWVFLDVRDGRHLRTQSHAPACG